MTIRDHAMFSSLSLENDKNLSPLIKRKKRDFYTKSSTKGVDSNCNLNCMKRIHQISSQTLIVVSAEPLTSLLPINCKHRTVPECPTRWRTGSVESEVMSQTY